MTTEISKAETNPFQLFDELDDQATALELAGRISEHWVYRFSHQGKEVIGLSKIGVDEACRELAKHGEVCDEQSLAWHVDPADSRYVLFEAVVQRIAIRADGATIPMDHKIATKRQCLFIIRREGVTNEPNPFWFETGSAKALRNASSRLLPEYIKADIIAKARALGKVKEVAEPIRPPEAK